MADEKKGITVKIDARLHAQVRAYIEAQGMTMAQFITAACDDLLHPKFTQKEEKNVENMRTVAFQVPESLFQRIKEYLQRNNMTQRQFLLGLIETELDREQAQREAAVGAVCHDGNQEDEVLGQDAENPAVGGVPEEYAPETGELDEAEEEADEEFYEGFDPDEAPEDESEDDYESEDEEESAGMVMGM